MVNRFFFFSLSSITMPARRENIEGGYLHAATTNIIVTNSLDLARSSKKQSEDMRQSSKISESVEVATSSTNHNHKIDKFQEMRIYGALKKL
jgi:hypothetical protein